MRLIRTNRYLKDLKRMGATAADVAKLEREIVSNPTAGDVIPGLGGLRKLRFGLGNRGKRGGGRAIYFLMLADDTAALVFAYSKSEREDLTEDEKKAVVAMMKELTSG